MNILFLSRLFYPHIGGVEKHVWEISKRLISKGHRVTVITENLSKKRILKVEIINSIKVYRIPIGKDNWFKKFRIWRQLFKLRKIIANADIVHCHDVFFWYFPFRFLFPRKPIFTTFHGYENFPLKPRWVFARRLSEKLSFGTICVGEFMKKWYGTKSNYVSYGGVNIVQSSKLKVKSLIRGAVFVGRLDEQTGIKTYVKAVKLIRKRIPHFELVVLGDGKLRKDIEEEVEVLGFQKNPEKYFSKYRFAFVSRYLSILEAMAKKRLVFAVYDNPLKKDYLSMTPFAKFIIIVKSEKELAKKVFYFLRNQKEEKEIVEKAFNFVKNESWQKVCSQYLDLWKKT